MAINDVKNRLKDSPTLSSAYYGDCIHSLILIILSISTDNILGSLFLRGSYGVP